MKVVDIRQTTTLHAPPADVYKAITNPAIYRKVTGRVARFGRREGDPYSSFDGFIDGVVLHLEPGRKVVRSWRAHQLGWPEDHYSQVSMTLSAVDGGTRVTCLHRQVPAKLAQEYREGWTRSYWRPLKAWFSRS